MEYNFDRVPNRYGTNSVKFDFARENHKPEDIIPLWVADMDFQSPPGVLDCLEKAVRHGVFGYTQETEAYYAAVGGWYRRRFGWETKSEWLVKTPGVVFAIAAAIRAFTKEGDAVLLQQPVYHPFRRAIRNNGRTLVNNPLRETGGRYEIDFEDFEQKIRENQVKLFILCSPHNPVGRVWETWELKRLGEICMRYGVLVVSDEIHSDFVYPGHTHHVFASLSPEFEARTITCTAPSKTFNLAGLQTSNIFIADACLREAFLRELAKQAVEETNRMGLLACQAAYETGEEWLEALKVYLKGNVDFVRSYLESEIPELHLTEPEGTYLLWVDFRELGLSRTERENLIEQRAKLWLNDGAIFGAEGEGFERINIGCPRATLEKALRQLAEAVRNMG